MARMRSGTICALMVASMVIGVGCSGASDTPVASGAPASAATGSSTPSSTVDTVAVSSIPVSTGVTTTTSFPAVDPRVHEVYDSVFAAEGGWNAAQLLAVFAAKVEPVPGIAAAGAADAALVDDHVLFDGLGEIVDSLPAEQQAVVRRWLEPADVIASATFRIDDNGVVEVVDGVERPVDLGADGPSAAPPDTLVPLDTIPGDAHGFAAPKRRQAGVGRDYITALLKYVSEYRRLTGVTGVAFSIGTQVVDLPGGILADARSDPGFCTVRIDAGTDVHGDADFRDNTVAHEAYHCFQYAVRTARGLAPVPVGGWVTEGTASYASLLVQDSSAWSSGWYSRWMERPDRALPTRAYDAIGFYRSVDEATSVDMWKFMYNLVVSQQPTAELGSLPGAALAHWGGGHFGNRALGSNWFFLQPYAGTAAAPLSLPLAASGAQRAVPVPAMSARTVHLDGLTGDAVLTITSTTGGVIKFSGEADSRLLPATPVHACFSEASCAVCPGREDLRFSLAKGPSADVGAASVSGGELTFTLQTKAQACEFRPPVGGDRCLIGSWVSNELQADAPPEATYHGGGDGVRLDIREDGTFTMDFFGMSPYVVQFTGPSGFAVEDPQFKEEVRFAGAFDGVWEARDGVFNGAGPGMNDVQVVVTMAGPGTPSQTVLDTTVGELAGAADQLVAGGVPGVSFDGMAFTCDGSHLTLSKDSSGWTYTRQG